MNPYAFRSWHFSTPYSETANCDRNYPGMYPTSWTTGYFPTPSMYPFQTDSSSAKQATSADWKLNSTDSPNIARDSNLMKSSYEGLLYKTAASNTRPDFDTCSREDPQRSCCAMACSCSNHQRLNVLDNTWRNSDMSPSLDFSKTPSMSPYQSLCQRGKGISYIITLSL